jgi:hypothetical protein
MTLEELKVYTLWMIDQGYLDQGWGVSEVEGVTKLFGRHLADLDRERRRRKRDSCDNVCPVKLPDGTELTVGFTEGEGLVLIESTDL